MCLVSRQKFLCVCASRQIYNTDGRYRSQISVRIIIIIYVFLFNLQIFASIRTLYTLFVILHIRGMRYPQLIEDFYV